MAANAVDLTTIAQVSALIAPENAADAGASAIIQILITAMSRFVTTSVLGRRNVNTSVALTDVMDGSGSDKIVLKDWPVTAIASLAVWNVGIPASPDGVQPGFVFDDRSVILLPNTSIGAPLSYWNYTLGRFPRGRLNVSCTYTAGYTGATNPPSDASYNGAPSDLGGAVTYLVAQEYKRRNWIDQASKTLSEAHESVTFTQKEWPLWVNRVMRNYKRFHYV